jgi:hypothetical protein
VGAATGYVVRTNYYDGNFTAGSGATFKFTGVTTLGKAGNVPDADGYFYDADGKQFLRVSGVAPGGAVAVDGAFAAMCAAYLGSGKTITLEPGNYRITQQHDIDGFILVLSPGAEIEVYGTSPTPFVNGALLVKNDGVLRGGVVYTSGTMLGGFDYSAPVGATSGGSIMGFTEVYSQLYSCVQYSAPGNCEVVMHGGRYRGFEARLFADGPCNFDVRYMNCGVAYISKVFSAQTLTDSRTVHVNPNLTIKSRINLNVSGQYCAKNAVWVAPTDTTLYSVNDVYITGKVSNAGTYLDGAGAEQFGHGAGTCIEILGCPDAVIDAETYRPLGYNVAIVSYSHGAKVVGGWHQGADGDPSIVVANSNNVVISSRTDGGTVGVSIGEDGATSNNCKILNHVFNDGSANPVRFENGSGLIVSNCTFVGEPTLASVTGSWAGPGKIKAAVSVYETANDVAFTGNTISGWFTHDVISYGYSEKLRIARGGNTYNTPIMARTDVQYHPLHQQTEGVTPLLRVTTDAATDGHTGVGEVTLLAAGPTFSIKGLNPLLYDVTNLYFAGETGVDILQKYAVLVYVKYVPAMQGNQIRFGIMTSYNASHYGAVFYSTIDGIAGSNSVAGKFHSFSTGGDEWIPLLFGLDTIIYNSADKTSLAYFLVNKHNNPATYDLTFTNPVLVYVGKKYIVAP